MFKAKIVKNDKTCMILGFTYKEIDGYLSNLNGNEHVFISKKDHGLQADAYIYMKESLQEFHAFFTSVKMPFVWEGASKFPVFNNLLPHDGNPIQVIGLTKDHLEAIRENPFSYSHVVVSKNDFIIFCGETFETILHWVKRKGMLKMMAF